MADEPIVKEEQPKEIPVSPPSEKKEATVEDSNAALTKELEQAKKTADYWMNVAKAEKGRRIQLQKARKPSSEVDILGEPPATELTPDLLREKEKAEKLMLKLVYSNKEYRDYLESHPALKEIFDSNPLAFTPEALDADDATMQLEEKFADWTSKKPASQTPPKTEEPKPEGVEVTVPPVNVPVIEKKKSEEAKGKGDIEGSIFHRLEGE